MSTAEHDILIVGGGMVGLTCATLLAQYGEDTARSFSIGIVETSPPAPVRPNADIELRVSALSRISRTILQFSGIWPAIAATRISPYRRMCVWQADGAAGSARSISFDAAELGEPDLGCIVENGVIRRAAWERVNAMHSVSLHLGSAPAALHEETDALELILENGQRLRTRLLVGADGARSWVRQALGVTSREREYGQRAIVAHVESQRSHRETAWQRFIAGGPVALLPLDDGRSSVVWSCPDATAAELMAADKRIFDQRLTLATDQVLGSLTTTTERADFPLSLAYAQRYTGRRYALIGDAAHRVHPLAGQGANLGLLDAAALAETLAVQQASPVIDPGDPVILRRYERWRKGDNLLTMGVLDGLHRLFGAGWVPAARLGGLGLGIVDRLAPVKRRLALYAMGDSGDLPMAARVS
ncbi:MAG: FAD-dependent monooxygenase [Gammaproteobacteria bacterium]